MLKNILVVGDLILDRRVECTVDRLAPEAPVLVGRTTEDDAHIDEYTPGGAGHVAVSAAMLGANTILVVPTSTEKLPDAVMRKALKRIDAYATQLGRDFWLDYDPVDVNSPFRVPTKTRYVESATGRHLFRFDCERELSEQAELLQDGQVLVTAQSVIDDALYGAEDDINPGVDTVILVDYDGGAFADHAATAEFIANNSDCRIIAAPKPANAKAFIGADCVVMNESELYQLYRDWGQHRQEIFYACRQMMSVYNWKQMICTRGSAGVAYVINKFGEIPASTDTRAVVDVSGAGDVVTATYAVTDDVNHANVAAGLFVRKPGMAPVTQEELDAGLIEDKICAPDEAIRRTAVHRNRGDGITFTNGHFDLLHKGHMHLLLAASRGGDFDTCRPVTSSWQHGRITINEIGPAIQPLPAYFVVALNTDASAKRGKGDDRPFQPLELRAKTIAQLPFVDVVTWFDEDTPESLIRGIQPDALVKGSSNASETIPGAEFVRQHGGEVLLVDEIDEYSTTSTVSGLLH
ncbi:ADP-heptose synthase [uncultured Mediterranean phage]|nr:ADP-heptose synthase [uncultured Mediterranean phage]